MKKILLLGLGFFGSHWYNLIESADDCELAAVCALREDKEKFLQSHKINVPVYEDYVEAIEKTDADIVVIVIPTPLHTKAARLALKKGMHILSEKPLTDSMEDASDILKFKAGYPKLKYMISQNYRWRPHTKTLARLIREGFLGDTAELFIEFRRPEDLIGYREFLELPLIQDVSIHHFDLIRYLSGSDCECVFADTWRPSWSMFAGKSSADVLLKMKNNMRVSYHATWAARGHETSWDGSITICGEKGCLCTGFNDEIVFYPADGGAITIEADALGLAQQQYALSMFIDCIDNDKTPECTIEDNIRSYEIVCAAEKSARTGERVWL